ncbi:MAG: hypothetical protein ACK4YD_07820, partial [Chitinophagia bacterium]
MRRQLMYMVSVVLMSVFASSTLYAQFSNEWIDYNKTYYKFKVGQTGLFRIPQSVLQSAGVGTAKAEHFQLWRNGQEVPLFTSVQFGSLSPADYIEFFGQMNDGKPDA